MYDISDLELTHEERDQQLTELRRHTPVTHDEQNDLWLVTRHADVTKVSRNPKIYSSAPGISYFDAIPLALITTDDPEHGRLRRIVSKRFSPRMVEQLRGSAARYTNECIDAVAADASCDFVAAIAGPVTLKVIADMSGIPHEDLPQIKEWTDVMMDSGGRLEEPGVAEAAALNYGLWTGYVNEHVARRTTDPGDDLISQLAHADEDRLVDEELSMFVSVLMIAGNETTRHTSTRGLELLHRHPDAREAWKADPSIGPTVVEEILRWSTVVRGMMRTTTEDTTLAGAVIPEGSRVMMVYPSANRDESVFEEPFDFRHNRNPNPQLAFGIGTHFCLGANLARMEVEVILSTVLERLPDIELVPGTEPVHRANGLIAGVAEMSVQFTPAARR